MDAVHEKCVYNLNNFFRKIIEVVQNFPKKIEIVFIQIVYIITFCLHVCTSRIWVKIWTVTLLTDVYLSKLTQSHHIWHLSEMFYIL